MEGRFLGVPRRQKTTNLAAPQGEEIEPHVLGLREVLWEVRVRSHRNAAGEDAFHYLRLVEAALHDPGPTGFPIVASGLGLGLQTSETIVDLTATLGDRRVSIAQLDVRLHAWEDHAMPAYGYVDTLEVETQWRGPDGNLLPPGSQFQGEIP
jgi:hypothetical protein